MSDNPFTHRERCSNREKAGRRPADQGTPHAGQVLRREGCRPGYLVDELRLYIAGAGTVGNATGFVGLLGDNGADAGSAREGSDERRSARSGG